MSDPDRVSLAFIWDTDVAPFQPPHVHEDDGVRVGGRLRRRVRQQQQAARAAAGRRPAHVPNKAEAKTLNFYNWTDYIADDTIPNFQKETGIKVTYDNYSSNDELFAKLSAGQHGLRHHRADRRDAREDEAREPASSRSTSR